MASSSSGPWICGGVVVVVEKRKKKEKVRGRATAFVFDRERKRERDDRPTTDDDALCSFPKGLSFVVLRRALCGSLPPSGSNAQTLSPEIERQSREDKERAGSLLFFLCHSIEKPLSSDGDKKKESERNSKKT